jgi:hypothetical protein
VRRSAPLAGLLLAAALGPRTAVGELPAMDWQPSSPGVERGAFEMSGGGEGWRTRVVAVRVDPESVRFRLRARVSGGFPAWRVERAPADAVLAVNTGQFTGFTPWGWVVMQGEEIRPPGRGPLAPAIGWDAGGRTRWLDAAEIEASRRRGDLVEAVQSYPTLLDAHGRVPRALTDAGRGVDVNHRDRRLAIGEDAEGRIVVALTRFYGFGELSPDLPFGLTLAEMADVMRGLGCRRAVALDGGVSAQLMVREGGEAIVWRSVPLGLIAERSPR